MAPVKGPFLLVVHHVVVMMVMVMMHSSACGCNRHGKRDRGERGQNESNLLHNFLHGGLVSFCGTPKGRVCSPVQKTEL
jgi:hypothetical protein